MIEMQARADEYVRQCAERLEAATAAVQTAKSVDAGDVVEHLKRGAKGTVGFAASRAARQAERDALDECDSAALAQQRVNTELLTLAEQAALSDNVTFIERNRLIADYIKQLIAEGESVRRRDYVIKALLSSLLAASAEVPVLDHDGQLSEPAKIRCQAERDQPVAEARELAKQFMLANVREADRVAGEAASQRLRFQISKLLEEPNTEITVKEEVSQ
jgi:hypothetical protein